MKHALLALLLLPWLATGPAHGQAAANGPMNQPAEPYRILGNLYYVGASDVTSFLIATPAGLILIDSGFAETVPMIRKHVEALGFKMADVKILLNSHPHFDHAGGLAAIKKQTGAKLAASQADAVLLASGGRGDHLFGDKYPYEPVTADRILKDGDRVELGGTALTAHLTPGHTKGCTTWTMKVAEGGRSYDVVFICSTSLLDGVSLTKNARYPNVAADFEQTFRTLRELPCDIFLGSHASFYNGLEKAKRLRQGADPNPFIDPAGYKAYLDRSEKAFRERLAAEKTTPSP